MVLDIIIKTLREYNLLNNGDSVLVGLSGGADSVCLTHALWSLKDEFDIKLYTAHINHGIRGEEAKRDELFAENFSKKLGIECFVLNADIPQIAKDTNVSEETAGRNVRYNFFNKLCEKNFAYEFYAWQYDKRTLRNTVCPRKYNSSDIECFTR